MIRFKQVVKQYPNKHLALNDVSFVLNPGELVFISGHSGAGKSTLVQGVTKRLHDCLTLDLDVCVPDWMKENFNKGLYPTLAQRREFANDCVWYSFFLNGLQYQQTLEQ